VLFKTKDNTEVEVNIGDLIRFRGRSIGTEVKGKIFLATKMEKITNENPNIGTCWEVLLVCNQQIAYLYPEDGSEIYEIVSRLDAPLP
jgi:hypothetical protein